MVDQDEVVRLVLEDEEFNRRLARLQRNAPRALKVLEIAGKIGGFKDLNAELIVTEDLLDKNRIRAEQLAKKLQDIELDFAQGEFRGDDLVPRSQVEAEKRQAEEIRRLKEKQEDDNRRQLGREERDRERARKKELSDLKRSILERDRLNKKAARERERDEKAVTRAVEREQKRQFDIRKKQQIAALRFEERIRKQRERNESKLANTRRAGLSRGLRIGAGVAGAFGNFQFASGLFTASTAVQGLPLDNFKNAQGLLQGVGVAAAQAIPLVAGLGSAFAGLAVTFVAVKEGLAFEDALARTSTLLTEASLAGLDFRETLEGLEGVAISLSSQFNVGLEDAVEGFRVALSAGINADELERFSNIAAELATATGTSFERTTDILTTLRDSYKLSIGDLTEVNNVLFRTIDEGKVEVDDLIANLGRVAPIASQAGISFRELFGAIAFATRQGLKPGQAITSIAKAIESIVSPSDKAKRAFDALGIQTGLAAFAGREFADVFAEINAKVGGARDTIFSLFPEDRAARFAASASSLNEQLQDISNFVGEAGADTADAFNAANRALDSTSARISRLGKAIRGELARGGIDIIADTLESIFGSLGDTVEERAKNFATVLANVRTNTIDLIQGIRALGNAGAITFDTLIESAKVLASLTPLGFLTGITGDPLSVLTDGFEDLRNIASQTQNQIIGIARELSEVDREGAIELLSSRLGLAEEKATALVDSFISGQGVDKAIEKVRDLAGVVENSLVTALDQVTASFGNIDERLNEFDEQREKLDRQRLTGVTQDERSNIKLIEQQIQDLELARNRFATEVSRGAKEVFADLALEAREAISNVVDSGSTQDAIERINEVFGALVSSGALRLDEFAPAFLRIRRAFKEFTGEFGSPEGLKVLDNVRKEFDTLFASLDKFGPSVEGLTQLSFRGIVDTDDISTLNSYNTQLELLRDKILSIIGVGKTRSAEDVLELEQQGKLLKNATRDLEKFDEQVKRFGRRSQDVRDVSAEIATLNEKIMLTRQLAEASLTLGQFGDADSARDAAAATKQLLDLQRELQDLTKIQDKFEKQRIKTTEDFVESVKRAEQRQFKEVEKFQKRQTKLIEDEVRRRENIINRLADITAQATQDVFAARIGGARSDRQRREISRSEIDTARSRAEAAISSGDIDAFEQAIADLRNAADILAGATREGRRRENVQIGIAELVQELAERFGASASERSQTMERDLRRGRDTVDMPTTETAIQEVIDAQLRTAQETESILSTIRASEEMIQRKTVDGIAAITNLATSQDALLSKLVNEEGKIVIDRSESTTTITVQNLAETTEDLANAIRDVLQGQQARQTGENVFTPENDVTNLGILPEKSERQRGGAFGT